MSPAAVETIPFSLPLHVVGALALKAHEREMTLNDYLLEVFTDAAQQTIQEAAAAGRVELGETGTLRAMQVYEVASIHDAKTRVGYPAEPPVLAAMAEKHRDRFVTGLEHLVRNQEFWRVEVRGVAKNPVNSSGHYDHPVTVWLVFA